MDDIPAIKFAAVRSQSAGECVLRSDPLGKCRTVAAIQMLREWRATHVRALGSKTGQMVLDGRLVQANDLKC